MDVAVVRLASRLRPIPDVALCVVRREPYQGQTSHILRKVMELLTHCGHGSIVFSKILEMMDMTLMTLANFGDLYKCFDFAHCFSKRIKIERIISHK
ncbi:hypothetical protein KP509_31G068700 [Ceratopteris richardii]|uniref:Uncharacterized protein n=1 Tax=Ceratopteris richardii TaxID=49495 RepID=A0A8T2QYX6_CERRI|nr:hypothetical protein KP509_31G068700 [Ceratopteris richardii]